MPIRRHARECAVQLLFQLDLNPSDNLDTVFKVFWTLNDKGTEDPQIREFAERLTLGVQQCQTKIDATIKKCADNWDIKRMGVIERNVMRMAVYEMLHCPDIPPAVSINEAVDIAKFFGSAGSGKFVNGVLDRIRKDMHKAAKTNSPAPESAERRTASPGRKHDQHH
jgi:transcription antitermination protein NusB